ncbi:MAG TPA: alpha/beta hydrolase-fold protein [Dongiaceae bacterium]|nr:alpha/beta hydrolase-fold protein [Dongiaceae bacterium]
MMRRSVALLSMLAVLGAPAGAAPPPAPRIVVQFDRSVGELHGRLLVFLQRLVPSVAMHGPLEPGFSDPHAVEIVGTEVESMPAGSAVEVPADADAYPTTLRALSPGWYVARAELDVHHRYTYDGGQPGDPTSANVAVHIVPGAVTTIVVSGRRPAKGAPRTASPSAGRMETFVSPSLSAFFGRPITMRAYVEPPRDYATSGRRYATVYVVGGYGETGDDLPRAAAGRTGTLARAGGTQLIYVHLDPHVPLGHSVFADSVNNGPWGRALTTELIPYLESRWRMTATERTRFLTGHSSGGWTTMWLQVTYPSVFGGTWSTSPDPLDFQDFTGPNLVDDPAGNIYHTRSGRPYMLVRIKGKDVVPLRDYILQERALGPYGGQFRSFDAVFSPRGEDGRPKQLFDRATGRIDPSVARYWEAHYDIVRTLRDHWATLGPTLHGKLHVAVGSWDTFQLERGVMRLRDALAKLPGSDAQIEIVPERTHMDLYRGPNGGLYARIDREMTAAAAAP